MKKFCITMLILFVLLASQVFAAGGSEASSAKNTVTKTIKVTTKFVDNEQTAKSLVKVCDAINARSGGSLNLQLYTGGTFPIGKDGMELVTSGADVILVDGVNFLGDYIPDYNAVTGPFLYTSFDEYLAMTKSDLVKNLNSQALEKGIQVLSRLGIWF